MRLHREGTLTILLIAGLCCIGSYAAWHGLPRPAAWALILPMAAVLAIVVWFFRVPTRPVGQLDHRVLSPCDGKVVVVEEVLEPEYFKDRRRQVSIFMSPLNVHINFHPVSGTATYRQYHPGKYLVAWHPKSSTENERTTVVVKHPEHGEILVRQIAGALARRICTYTQPDEAVQQGTEFGFIKFGSRVDLFLPLSAAVKVNIGDRVQGAVSLIAEFGT